LAKSVENRPGKVNTLSFMGTFTYGKIDASNTLVDVTTDTVFQLSSISNTFVGVAVAMLVDAGMITLDDFICDTVLGETNTACQHPDFMTTDNVSKITWRSGDTQGCSSEKHC
jgi:hypothetical protein